MLNIGVINKYAINLKIGVGAIQDKFLPIISLKSLFISPPPPYSFLHKL